MSSSTLSLWAVPSLTDPSQKKPNQSARNPATSVLNGLVPQDFGAGTQGRTEVESRQLQFGAFRSFEDRAETARNQAMQVAPEQLRTKTVSDALDIWWANVKEPSVKKPRTKEAYLLYMKHL